MKNGHEENQLIHLNNYKNILYDETLVNDIETIVTPT